MGGGGGLDDVLAAARGFAAARPCDWVTTAELLVALAVTPDEPSARVLGLPGAEGPCAGRSPAPELPLTPRCRVALKRAELEATGRGQQRPDPIHLLTVLAADADTEAERVWRAWGLVPGDVRTRAVEVLGPSATELTPSEPWTQPPPARLPTSPSRAFPRPPGAARRRRRRRRRRGLAGGARNALLLTLLASPFTLLVLASDAAHASLGRTIFTVVATSLAYPVVAGTHELAHLVIARAYGKDVARLLAVARQTDPSVLLENAATFGRRGDSGERALWPFFVVPWLLTAGLGAAAVAGVVVASGRSPALATPLRAVGTWAGAVSAWFTVGGLTAAGGRWRSLDGDIRHVIRRARSSWADEQ